MGILMTIAIDGFQPGRNVVTGPWILHTSRLHTSRKPSILTRYHTFWSLCVGGWGIDYDIILLATKPQKSHLLPTTEGKKELLEKGLFHIGGPFNLLSSFHWPHVESGIFRCMATIHPVDQDGTKEGRPKAYCCGQKIACKNYKGLLECG